MKIRKLKILSAILFAILAMAVSYFCTNLNVSVSGERDVLKYWNAFISILSNKSDGTIPDNVLFIDVSSDKQLVDRTDEIGRPIGNAAITDRQKLAEMLDLIKEAGNYEYVLLDVFFGDGFETAYDSILFNRIVTMDRIVIPQHKDGILASPLLEEKAAYSDYTTTLKEDNFTKYPLLDKQGNLSIPLRMYSDMTGRTIKRAGLLYLDRHSLSRRVVFPKMYLLNATYRYLGASLLDYRDVIDWNSFLKDKIIVFGSFIDDDIHLTYAGDVPGCVINYNVVMSLMRGQHRIPIGLIIAYFLIFFFMSLLLLSGESDINQSWAWIWAKLFVLYSVILTLVCILVFTIWGQAHDVLLTSTFFSVVDTCHRWVINRKKNA